MHIFASLGSVLVEEDGPDGPFVVVGFYFQGG